MVDTSLLVTFSVDEREREAIEGPLPDGVEVTYLDELPESRRTGAVGEADFLLSWSPSRDLTDELFERLRDDQVLQLVSAGVDQVPFDRLPEGMVVCNNAGAYAEPMAEHVLAMYLALAKRLHVEDRNMREGEFNQFTRNRWIRDSVCGIVGFGGVGEATARLLKPLGVRIFAINRHGESDEPTEFLGTPDDLEYVLRRCDGLVIGAPLTPETRGLVDREKLQWMADDAILINVARGEIVDQGDLYDHLTEHPEFQAGLEAWWTEPIRHGEFDLDYPLLDLPNVLGCPHNSAMVPDVMELGARAASRNVARAAAGGSPENVVDPTRGY